MTNTEATNVELGILSVKDFFNNHNKLEIPDYQRPYRWNYKTANTLLNDIIEAKEKELEKYRLGTVILHKDDKDNYNIVDGQQRLTSLSILLYCINENLSEESDAQTLLKCKYSDLSYNAININYNFYKTRINNYDKEELKGIRKYILENCELVEVVTGCEQEAFQFFDSQNNRGKSLRPHDLLKSYHLREMNKMNVSEKKDLINKWEDLDQKELAYLFEKYLYCILRWYKKRDGLNFSDKKIEIFKGIKQGDTNNYAVYHKASNLYIEQFNKNGNSDILSIEELNQYQLTQPIIAGKRFFSYVLHYTNLLQEIKNKKNSFESCIKEKKEISGEESIFPRDRIGDRYIAELYESILLFFADRFSLSSIDYNVMKKIYVYCYSLRLSMEKIGLETINNYACGIIPNRAKLEIDDKNNGIAIFERIGEMTSPEEVNLLVFPRLSEIEQVQEQVEKRKQEHIFTLVCEWCGINNNKEDKNNTITGETDE